MICFHFFKLPRDLRLLQARSPLLKATRLQTTRRWHFLPLVGALALFKLSSVTMVLTESELAQSLPSLAIFTDIVPGFRSGNTVCQCICSQRRAKASKLTQDPSRVVRRSRVCRRTGLIEERHMTSCGVPRPVYRSDFELKASFAEDLEDFEGLDQKKVFSPSFGRRTLQNFLKRWRAGSDYYANLFYQGATRMQILSKPLRSRKHRSEEAVSTSEGFNFEDGGNVALYLQNYPNSLP